MSSSFFFILFFLVKRLYQLTDVDNGILCICYYCCLEDHNGGLFVASHWLVGFELPNSKNALKCHIWMAIFLIFDSFAGGENILMVKSHCRF